MTYGTRAPLRLVQGWFRSTERFRTNLPIDPRYAEIHGRLLHALLKRSYRIIDSFCSTVSLGADWKSIISSRLTGSGLPNIEKFYHRLRKGERCLIVFCE